jgi:hypothetical protein
MEYYKRHYGAASLLCTAENLEEIQNFCKYFANTDVTATIDGDNIIIVKVKNNKARICAKVTIDTRIWANGDNVWCESLASHKERFFGFHEISKNEYYKIVPQYISLSSFDNFTGVQYFTFHSVHKTLMYNGKNKEEIESEFKLDTIQALLGGVEYLQCEGWSIAIGEKIFLKCEGGIFVFSNDFNPFCVEQITESEYKEFVIKQKEHLAQQQ